VKTGSMDERRLLADVRSGREALQEMAASLRTLASGGESRSEVEKKLEACFVALLGSGTVTVNGLTSALDNVGRPGERHWGLSVERRTAASRLAAYVAAMEVKE
jgi:5-deoxy-D-glucuronate isomerase